MVDIAGRKRNRRERNQKVVQITPAKVHACTSKRPNETTVQSTSSAHQTRKRDSLPMGLVHDDNDDDCLPCSSAAVKDQCLEQDSNDSIDSDIESDDLSFASEITFQKIDGSNDNIEVDIRNSTRVDGYDEDQPIVSLCAQHLSSTGLVAFWTDILGKSRKKESAISAAGRVAKLLCFTYMRVYDKEIVENEILTWFRDLIFKKYTIIQEFCKAKLTDELLQSPSTVQQYLSDIVSAAKWLVCFWDERETILSELQMNVVCDGFKHTIDALRKCYALAKRKEYGNVKTMKDYVHNRKAPIGGLDELKTVVRNKLSWANDIVKYDDISIGDYRDFMRLLAASIYVCAPNGRPQAIASLRYKDGTELLRRGMCSSTKFKTNYKYHYQPVIVNGISRHLLQLYLTRVRKMSANGSNITDDDPLWVMHNGQRADIGKLVATFFEQETNLSVNVTVIRALLNTSSTDLYYANKITHEQLVAIQNINGHSGSVAQNHYYLSQADAEAINGVAAFNQIVNNKDDSCLWHELIEKETIEAAPWGDKHKDRYKTCRAGWSIAELKYLDKWKESHRHITKNVVSNCLKSIRKDKEAIPFFHPFHILKADRLRYGFQALVKWKNKQYDELISHE